MATAHSPGVGHRLACEHLAPSHAPLGLRLEALPAQPAGPARPRRLCRLPAALARLTPHRSRRRRGGGLPGQMPFLPLGPRALRVAAARPARSISCSMTVGQGAFKSRFTESTTAVATSMRQTASPCSGFACGYCAKPHRSGAGGPRTRGPRLAQFACG